MGDAHHDIAMFELADAPGCRHRHLVAYFDETVRNCGLLAEGFGALAALAGKPGMAAYTASKAAVIRLTESMAAELRDKGINVNCVLPSILDTPANRAAMPKADFAKWVAPEALAEAIAFLCSDAARAIHGAAIPVSGLS